MLERSGALLLGLGMALFGCVTGSDDIGYGYSDAAARDGARDSTGIDTGCGIGLVTCDDKCVDTAFDREHCGACGTKCAGAEVCKAGKCSSDCGTMTSCPGEGGIKCVNTKTDTAHCGSCGKACPAGQLCADGLCAPDCGTATRCPGATPYCADVKTDVKNCGYCGNACPSGQECVAGSCTLACMPPTTKCGSACTNTDTDPDNCGACAAKCTLASATAGCAGGTCTVASCASGYGNCDGVASNGCEINTATNVSNCGSCGNACSVTNGTAGCSGGACTVASCNANYGNCDGSAGNGCEVNHLTSSAHCGSCGNACSSGQTCKSGTCVTVVTGTYTATINYSGSNYCLICGSATYLCIPGGGAARSFTDPMPSGGKATSITVRVYGVGCSGGLTNITLNGTSIGSFTASGNCSCNSCDAPYSVTVSNPSGVPGYSAGGSNSINIIPARPPAPCVQRTEIAVTAG